VALEGPLFHGDLNRSLRANDSGFLGRNDKASFLMLRNASVGESKAPLLAEAAKKGAPIHAF
jgi:hypothetical protein